MATVPPFAIFRPSLRAIKPRLLAAERLTWESSTAPGRAPRLDRRRYRFERSLRAAMDHVVVGVDPHKLSATIDVVDDHQRMLESGRFGTDRGDYTAILRYAKACPPRTWARRRLGRLLSAGEAQVSSSNCGGAANSSPPEASEQPHGCEGSRLR